MPFKLPIGVVLLFKHGDPPGHTIRQKCIPCTQTSINNLREKGNIYIFFLLNITSKQVIVAVVSRHVRIVC